MIERKEMQQLPKWPDPDKHQVFFQGQYIIDYQGLHKARAEAALARLRKAQKALRTIQVSAPIDPAKRWLSYDEIGAVVDEALQAIGEIPE